MTTEATERPGAIDADDLAMLGDGFAAAMADAPGAGDADAALFELGWPELLAAAPALGAATAFAALGTTGSAAGILDDVLALALGFEPSLDLCVVLPRPHRSTAPGHRDGDRVAIDGLVSARASTASSAIIAVESDSGTDLLTVPMNALTIATAAGIDPSGAYHRVTADLPDDSAPRAFGDGARTNGVSDQWDRAVAGARVALAHQLIGASRWMLDAARTHVLDREQFGRPIASFQAVRHKLAESLVAIEAAESIARACGDDVDPLLAALAKSLAGKAARTTATHAQQVLGGIGFTTDHDFQRWLKRTLVIDTLFGSASTIPTEIGRQLLAAGGAPRLLEL